MEKLEKDIQALRKQKLCVENKLKKITDFVKCVTGDTPIAEIQSRLDRCHALLKEFNEYDMKIIRLKPDEDGDLIFEDDYHMTVAMLMTWIRKKSVAEQISSSQADNTMYFNTSQVNLGNESDLKLPKLNIPKFSGNYTEWPSFFDLFTKTIHESRKLSQAQKFQYLKGLLDGEAASLLRHILVTENNYSIALAKLQDRYDRKRHIINAFIRKFIEQPIIQHSNANNLKRMMDTSDEVVRGLEALGSSAESRDPWLIYLLLDKLDDATRTAWANHSTDIDGPSFSEFIRFLSRRIDAFETTASAGKRNWPRGEAKSHITAPNETRSSVSKSEGVKYKCGYCSSHEHSILQCKDFIALDVIKRRDYVKNNYRCFNCLGGNHSVSKCLSRRRCQKCHQRHHTLLHSTQEISSDTMSNNHVSKPHSQTETNGVSAVCHSRDTCLAVLPTASIKLLNSTGGTSTCKALLDSGSQISLITNACVQRLNLVKEYSSMSVSGLGHSMSEKTRGLVRLKVKNNTRHLLDIVAFVIPRITCSLPTHPINLDIHQLGSIQLADPCFNKPSEIDLLIGSDSFFEIIRDGTKRIHMSNLYLQNTVFGWVIAGRDQTNEIDIIDRLTLHGTMDIMEIDATLRKFWEVESVGNSNPILSPEEKLSEEHFSKHTIRDETGQFVVKLPFKESTQNIGNTFDIALRRFHAIENRFRQNPEFKNLYVSFMQEYISLGHMIEIPSSQKSSQSYYLPHHGVLKASDSGSKLRVVFDGSAQPRQGKSLNSCLAVGPTVQASLFNILLRFREKRFVFSTDIEKMYRLIKVAKEDTNYQKILWRENTSSELKHYCLQTVTYGLSSAPFLATRALKQIANDVEKLYPTIATTINECIYVDDVMTGADTEEAALTIRHDLIEIFRQYGFTLKKWKANCKSLLKDLPIHHCESSEQSLSIEQHNGANMVKVLGICWNPVEDKIIFNVHLPQHSIHTKRTALSDASRLFDPIGWLAPVVVRMKVFVQQLWMKNLGWDDPLPDNLKTEWQQYREDLLVANTIAIPRHISTLSSSIVEIHGFSDASKLAYAAAVYYKVITGNDIAIHLATAKTKVAPTKQLSIPKLELSGALLLSQLVKVVMTETRIQVNQIFAWTDSKDVLDWLSDHPSKWTSFVGNRTAEILNILPRSCWRHVPSEFNPADCASRGMSPKSLMAHSSWWHGPHWLSHASDRWPAQQDIRKSAIELHIHQPVSPVPLHNNWLDHLLKKYSSFQKLQLVMCYIQRFINNIQKTKLWRFNNPIPEPDELLRSLNIICQYEQQRFFSTEISALHNGKYVHSRSILAALNPFLDEYNILRVGGRLENSECTYDVKHPIIIHTNSIITKPILHDIHLRYKHAGPSLMVNITRQTFWIPSLKNKVKSLVRNCVVCQRNKAVLRTQIMANLPSSRVIASRPFSNCGVDYAGPFDYHTIKGRGQRTHQGYACLFVCLTIKAVHIEFATDLTSDCFLAALKRFVARRGVPKNMFSDNGRNFVGAEAKLRQTFQNILSNSADIYRFSTAEYIKWHFNPPQAPHFGGIWESSVKSMKFHLKRVVGSTILSLEEMMTLLTEIEGILNSRPLCTTTDVNIDMLTPSHFLLGHNNTKIVEKDLTEVKPSHLTRWQMIQKMSQHYWDRWHLEYLSTLQSRTKWRHVKDPVRVNDVVIINEKHVPPCKWTLGRVTEVHPGPDGFIRVVSIKTSGGILQRPVHKICVLPVSQQDSEIQQRTESEQLQKTIARSTSLKNQHDISSHNPTCPAIEVNQHHLLTSHKSKK